MTTAVIERAHLAAIGRDLARLNGERGWRRSQRLLGKAHNETAVSFVDVARAPAWMRRAPLDQTTLACATALVAMAPVLAGSIDGDWLGELAKRAGEPALDHAISLAARVPGGGIDAVPADSVEGLGFDLLRVALPAPLRHYLAWAETAHATISQPLAAFCIAEVTRA